VRFIAPVPPSYLPAAGAGTTEESLGQPPILICWKQEGQTAGTLSRSPTGLLARPQTFMCGLATMTVSNAPSSSG